MKTLDATACKRQDERIKWLFSLDKKDVQHMICDDKNKNPIWDKILNFENLKYDI